METAREPLALYIHWPFCVSKCPYCDFNSHVRERVDVDAWRAALLADMAHEAALTGPRPLQSIFFGGGTPSLMPPALVGDLIVAAERYWSLGSDIEITLEANPNSVEVACFGELASAGVNRVSLGIQSFDNETLNFLGRAHNADEASRALDTAIGIFARVSLDLIYALPGQDTLQWNRQLRHAISWGAGHMSLYQLTIEPGTRFETMARRGEFTPLDADHAADLYELTQAMMRGAGLAAYEVSNHARAGEESSHNLAYWRYQDYAGIGPGAHGRRGGSATRRHRKPENWLSAVERNGHGIEQDAALTPYDRAREALMMGLRLVNGMDMAALERSTGLDEDEMLDMTAVGMMIDQGLMEMLEHRLSVTERGLLLLDAILPQIVL